MTWVGADNFCKGYNARLMEPRNMEEFEVMTNYVSNKKITDWKWVNYADMDIQAAVQGINGSSIIQQQDMGSVSRMEKVPIEMWGDKHENGSNRDAGQHCGNIDAKWRLWDSFCDGHGHSADVICEKDVDAAGI